MAPDASHSNTPGSGDELTVDQPGRSNIDEAYDSIKCMCGYDSDDGNTVFCEICNMWQHIDCYYPVVKVPDVHECVDCIPRPIDAEAAKFRQTKIQHLLLSNEKDTLEARIAAGQGSTQDADRDAMAEKLEAVRSKLKLQELILEHDREQRE